MTYPHLWTLTDLQLQPLRVWVPSTHSIPKTTPWEFALKKKKPWFPEPWEALESEESLPYDFVGSRLTSRKVSVSNWAIRCTKTQAPWSHVENTLPIAALTQPVSDMFHMISEGVKSSQYLHTEKQQNRAKRSIKLVSKHLCFWGVALPCTTVEASLRARAELYSPFSLEGFPESYVIRE